MKWRQILLVLASIFAFGCGPRSLPLEEANGTYLPFGAQLQDVLGNALEVTDVIGASAAVIIDGEGMWAGASGES